MAEAVFSMVLTKLGEMTKEEVNLHLNADSEVQKLIEKLEKIQKVLEDAEQKGLKDSKVRSWLAKLQDIAYDIDNVLDEWTHELLKQQFEEDEEEMEDHPNHHPMEKVISFLRSVCLCFNHVVERRNIALTVKELNGRLDSVAEENEKEFKCIPNVAPVAHEFKRIDSTSHIDLSEVQGREEELLALENQLVGNNASNGWGNSKSSVQVISIVGSGGMGKTTLSQLTFQRVKHQFDAIAWVCVSHPFDEIKIAKAILEALNMSSPNLTQLDPLLRSIESAIEDERFLIVLDDVWLENGERWKPFWNSLKDNGAPGSKILVTTRSTKVAKAMGSFGMDIQELSPLSDSDCWSILSRLAFRERNITDCEMLEKTGRLIADKCKGLPLAAKIVGSHLSSTNSLEEWENVLYGEVWELEKASTDLFPILRLSYSTLDPASKRCFSYCAMFPKDFQFNVDILKRFWMAQGFVPGRIASKVEENAQKIFDDLVARSFFQDFVRFGTLGCISHFKMHIIHDFAQFLTEKECLTVVLNDENTPIKPYSCQNARHVQIKSNKNTPISVNHTENIRTFVLDGMSEPPENLFNILKRTRALSLSNCEVVPEEVGQLIHLRFLSLAFIGNSELPGTICNLFQLQTLNLSDCYDLKQIPKDIHRLLNLRHLRIPKHIELPQGFEKLHNLRTLITFGANKDNKLGYLKNLDQLRILEMKIKDLNEADEVCEAERANLRNKKFLQYLHVELDISDEEISMDVAEALQPHANLPSLLLDGLHRTPLWMTTLTNLRELVLQSSSVEDWSHLAKLPTLEKFTANCMNLKKMGREFLGSEMAPQQSTADLSHAIFPRLKELWFRNCSRWKEWEDITEEEEENNGVYMMFPCLQSLMIYNCAKLRALPHRLLRKASQLEYLCIADCYYLQSRYNEDDGEDWEKISHISIVQFD